MMDSMRKCTVPRCNFSLPIPVISCIIEEEHHGGGVAHETYGAFSRIEILDKKAEILPAECDPGLFHTGGLIVQPIREIVPGIIRIIVEPDFLITDYFVVGGIGAALINAGLLTLMSIGVIYYLGM